MKVRAMNAKGQTTDQAAMTPARIIKNGKPRLIELIPTGGSMRASSASATNESDR